ncbi:MAG TPA: 3',5'-cyclic-nucleotide phosphodiesterase [Puia sp.]|nr:3',5'-cyclic-nucleotide phosphodiesterase [Puia sp.]
MNRLSCLLLLLFPLSLFAQTFTVIPLGVKGGLDESNLSSYMIAPKGSSDYVCLDAGTLYTGLQRAVSAGVLHASVGKVLRQQIKGYLISHPHLDHLAGLIINSPDDTVKTIYGMPYTIKVLEEKYFTWAAWANFGDSGETPVLKKYHYATMEAGREIPLTGTTMTVAAYPLSHGEPYQSTAFLVHNGGAYLLYLGDTGADTIEQAGKLAALWQIAGPLIAAGKLKAVFIETSFPNSQPEKTLFGHLTPRLLMVELNRLAGVAGAKALYNFPIVITHRKPSGNQEAVIKQELEADNPLHVKLIFPDQGKRYSF